MCRDTLPCGHLRVFTTDPLFLNHGMNIEETQERYGVRFVEKTCSAYWKIKEQYVIEIEIRSSPKTTEEWISLFRSFAEENDINKDSSFLEVFHFNYGEIDKPMFIMHIPCDLILAA